MARSGQFDHPSFTTAIGTAISGGIVLAVLFALLFVLPYLAFSAL